jgi:hypothetical protein
MIMIGGGAVSGVGDAIGIGNGSASWALAGGAYMKAVSNRNHRQGIANWRLPSADFDDLRSTSDRLPLTGIDNR